MLTTRRRRHATVAVTAVSAAASWALVTQLAGVHLTVRFPHSSVTTVGLGTVMAAASFATLMGWGLLVLLERKATRPRSAWVTAAVLVLLASMGLPIAFATTTSAVLGLIAIHLSVAAVAIIGLAGIAPRARPTGATLDAATRLGSSLA